MSCTSFEGIQWADPVSFPLLLLLCPLLYVSTERLNRREWTHQRPSFNSRAQERSSKDVTTSFLAPSFCSHMPKVSKHMRSHNRHPPTRHPYSLPHSLPSHTPARPRYPEAGLLTQGPLPHHTHSCECIGDSDPSARHTSLLGTTEQRIVFSPVEVRNPASSTSTSKAKTSKKESRSKKGKKKANVGASGIEDVAGSLNLTVEPGPITRGMMGGKEGRVGPDGDYDDDMYATEEGSDADGGGGDGERAIGTDANADLPPKKKRKPARNDKGKNAARSTRIRNPTAGTTPTTLAEPNVAQDQHQPRPPPSGSGISIPIDPALETLQVPTNQPVPQASGSSGGI